MLKMRYSGGTANRKNYPFVYITVMTFYGITGKFCDFPMVDAWPIAEIIDPINGYEAYRQSAGKLISLIKTFSYLTPLFINCLMTIHRVFIFLMPLDNYWFSDLKLFLYSFILSISVLISLLIPYYSSCSVNFDSRTSTYIAACAPGRHPMTLFQNKYAIWLPICSMCVNFAIIFWVKISRRLKNSAASSHNNTVATSSSLHVAKSYVKRENVMIRQAAAIAVYFSVYELGYLYMRLYPEQFEDWPLEMQALSYYVRLFAISSSNFFIYFLLTRSTRQLVLKFLGNEWMFDKKPVVATASLTIINN